MKSKQTNSKKLLSPFVSPFLSPGLQRPQDDSSMDWSTDIPDAPASPLLCVPPAREHMSSPHDSLYNTGSSSKNRVESGNSAPTLLDYSDNQPAITSFWDGVFHIVSIFRTEKTWSEDAANIHKSIKRIGSYIKNHPTRRPSRKEVIIPMAKSNAELIINSAHNHISNVNKCLKNSKSDIIVDFIRITNNGIIITTNKLVNALNLSTIEKFLKNINNVNLDLIEGPYLSKSKLYMKIVGLPYKIKQEVITPDYIEGVLKEMHLFKNVVLALKPHVIKVSPKSDIVVV